MTWESRNQISSVEFWSGAPERISQRFYIAFCLLMASVQDALLGQKEKQDKNLNWSATFSYYSLVHGGRLLCFLAIGDYPTQHNQLRNIFGSQPLRQHPFDWLSSFVSLSNPNSRQRSSVNRTYTYRQLITEYLQDVQLTEVDHRLNKYGSVLSAAARLRNDSNYEALLIAHEYEHITMTDAFERLSHAMAAAAESQLTFVIEAFNGFRRHDPGLPESRADYEAFLHHYVHGRIGDAIRRKLHRSREMLSRLDAIIDQIGTSSSGAAFDQLEHQVSMTLFSPKTELMRNFENHIADLERETNP